MAIGIRPMTPATENRQRPRDRGRSPRTAAGTPVCNPSPPYSSSRALPPETRRYRAQAPGVAVIFPAERRLPARAGSLVGWNTCRPTTRSCCCPSAAPRAPTTCCRSSRTSPAAAACPRSGWPRWRSTTTPAAGSARSTASAGTCSPRSARAAAGLDLPAVLGEQELAPVPRRTPCGRWPPTACGARSRS